MAYQVVVTDADDRSWNSIRDTDRQALFKVAEYMTQGSDEHIAYIGRLISSRLIFGVGCESIGAELEMLGLTLTITYIP
jgi:hypothetical protein